MGPDDKALHNHIKLLFRAGAIVESFNHNLKFIVAEIMFVFFPSLSIEVLSKGSQLYLRSFKILVSFDLEKLPGVRFNS